MLKRPSDRKQLLAELLKLDQYALLCERAKGLARQLKAQILLLEQSLTSNEKQLEQRQAIAAARKSLEAERDQLQARHQCDRPRLRLHPDRNLHAFPQRSLRNPH